MNRYVPVLENPNAPPRFKYIAICGHPQAGKTEVQKFLTRNHGVIPVDDGECLRDFGVNNLGLTPRQVETQDGKEEQIKFCGEAMTVRQFLGRLGNALEREFGEQAMPEIALARMGPSILGPVALAHSFGSVRKTQGITYKKHGRGIVIKITRPGVWPSGNDFDVFDEALVDLTVHNDGTLKDLESEVARMWAFINSGDYRTLAYGETN